MRKKDIKTFIEEAKKIHHNKYDYSKSEYVTSETKLCILCPKHGEFWQTPYVHLNLKCGCPKCGHEKTNDSKRHNKEKFIERAISVHGNKYDYSKVEYANNRTKVCIVCPEHGEFWQTPEVHLRGCGCKNCAINQKRILFSNGKEKFIERAISVHGNKYDYSKVEYVNANTKVCIVCPEHGEFWQEPHLHIISKYGCPKCGRRMASLNETINTDVFIERAISVHGNKYDYSKVEYVNAKSDIKIICKKHGEFLQTPDAHLHGCGCQRCSNTKSRGEEEIYEIIKNVYDDVEVRNRTEISPYELDIYIPKLRMAIEYNGLRWHSEIFNKNKNYHLCKLEKCNKNKIKLISIFEDEWVFKRNIVINKILHLIKAKKNSKKIYARKCFVKVIDKKTSNSFLEKYHIQGKCNSSLNYGCFNENILVGVMSFKKINKNNEWELTRFATDYNYICSGVGGKLFKAFIRENKPSSVKTFADRRWTLTDEENLYTKIGFKLHSILKPDYKYVVNNKRIHKFNFRKKNLSKKYNLPMNMTENEMCEKIGVYKIWDCGLFKYIWYSEKKKQ